jgi:hypothetical protein
MRGTRGGGGCAEGGGARSTRAVARATRVRAPRPPAAAACCCCCCCARTTARTRTTRGGGGGTCRPRPRRRRRRGRHAEGLFETLDETHARVRTPKTRTATHIEAARGAKRNGVAITPAHTLAARKASRARRSVSARPASACAQPIFKNNVRHAARARARGPQRGPQTQSSNVAAAAPYRPRRREPRASGRRPRRSLARPICADAARHTRGRAANGRGTRVQHDPPTHTHTHAARRGGGAPARRETHPGARHAPQTRHAREARAWLASPARAQRIVCARV